MTGATPPSVRAGSAALQVACVIATLLAPAPLRAQQEETDPFTTARFRFGPLAYTPTLALTNLGIDTNVFNEETNPRRDLTATLSPQVQAWLRLGRVRLSGRTGTDFVYFRQYSDQRSINTQNQLRLELPVNRIKPYVAASLTSTRQRPGYEIDTRPHRTERSVSVGVDLRVATRISVGVSASRTKTEFDADEVFRGTNLRTALNRRLESATATMRFALTPLTTFVILADAQRERFEFTSLRDADSIRVTPGFEFGAFALITGKVYAGYRKFDALGGGAQDYTGAVASAELGYTFLGSTHLDVRVERDIAYSIEGFQPTYLVTGGTASITQGLGGGFDVVARGGAQRLEYRHLKDAAPLGAGRIDKVVIYGGGVGYRLASDVRVGGNIDYYRRKSEIARFEYDGLKYGTTITLGF